MDFLAPIKGFDRLQRRVKPLAVTVAVLKNFSEQGAGKAAALIAYWGFFSIFPLLLLFVTILGLVLHGDPAAQRSIEHSVLQQFPIIGKGNTPFHATRAGLGVGIIGTLLSGLGVTLTAQYAFGLVYQVPHRVQPNFLISRWRGLKLLAVVGVLQVVSTIASGLVSGGLGGVWVTIGGIALSLVLNLALFFIVFRFLVPGQVRTRELWPGILLAAVGWEVLQSIGGVYIAHVVKGAGQTYGTFATVIGLLTWLYVGARVVVYAAEINVTLTRGLWPRSIMDPPTPADRKARAALAKMEERDDKETVEVAFHPPDPDETDELHHPPYAVAPRPAPGELATPAAIDVATPDLHTMTLAELLDAIGQRLQDVDAEPDAKEQARMTFQRVRQTLTGDNGDRGPDPGHPRPSRRGRNWPRVTRSRTDPKSPGRVSLSLACE
jgi:membrane protein